MKKQIITDSVLALTSDQIEEAIAKGFLRFVNSTSKLHRDYPAVNFDMLPEKSERKINIRLDGKVSPNAKNRGRKKSRRKQMLKGRVPIRSQTGHDHDRHHHK